jgi:hypothetical protein
VLEKHAACLRIRAIINEALDGLAHDAHVRRSATEGDPGVRGLTGNKEGWLETIPPEYRHLADTLFSDTAAGILPPHRPDSDCTIKLREGEVLKTCKLYDMSKEELEQLKKLLDLELERGFIRPSQSASSAPVFFVKDPGSHQLRLVIDYRDLNSKIELDDYPIPLTRAVMNDLAGADWITSMDVRSGFSNIRMTPGSEPHTAFKTAHGLYEYTVMPMGLATAPAVFQRFINKILHPYLGLFCHAYLDDVVIYTKGTLEEHKAQVAKVLTTLAENDLRLKPHKCHWFTKRCDFLGFTVVCGKGIRMSDDKIQGIRDLKPPRGVPDLRSFLGVVGFYDKFIPHYSDTVACLNDLLKKDVPWNWTPTRQAAFERIISSIRNDVFLRAFDSTKPVRFSTDASDEAYAGVLEQEYDDGWHPFLLFHHKFQASEKGWDIHDKELYAIVYGFSHYRHFLAPSSTPVQVFTDHRNLAKFMFSTNLLKSHDGRLGRWWEILSQYRFEIQYLPGSENVIPDFLSRYGYDASSTSPEHVLLPASRFSSKALADIESWFKKTPTQPNIRKLLEEKFADGNKKNSSPDPVPDFPPATCNDTIAAVRASRARSGQTRPTQTFCGSKYLHQSDLSLTRQRLALSLGLDSYTGADLDLLLSSANTRVGPDRRGLGA